MGTPKFKTFDTRPYFAKGEEPLQFIRGQVDSLKPGQGLTVIAPFIPAPLIEILKSEGFKSTLERRTDGGWAVNFWRQSVPLEPRHTQRHKS
jgi:uncharacterized protein (DUF2249 family)